ncbi:MAG: RNase adapter RapZ [Ancrocorticia sp.]|nr:RNase adapter RapZ [Ancrocorticia sp.]MCI1895479.1 RNase adapter RapZ [Ancrocorticia sp.]MCI1932152.1 RNase adapter RapZ [Ancrocorticia sp.]MCI1963512.1 RNase adapter RapZ [Ancrocorticia sp.]MCI2002294.1 RNase adapter RapZ [Ancrocorticia sp.]
MSELTETGSFPVIVPKLDAQSTLKPAEIPELLVISGMSGAGRSRAAATLEDLDWYVVDNLPARLLSALAGLISSDGGVARLAVVLDVRSRDFSELLTTLDDLRENGRLTYRILFLDCSDEELVRRFESTRRPHPLQGNGRLLDGIREERKLLVALRARADMVIDTSNYSVHDLSRKLRALLADEEQAETRVTVMSFGFKYGIPADADNVADVRFLPNPYWVSELRHLTGHDKPVADYVLAQDGAREFADAYADLMESILAGYARELKPFVTIAIGCTGGKHRSVAIAEYVSDRLRSKEHHVRTVHRDLGRE